MNPYEETADTLRDFLRREGYVRCDSPACNCGSYHGRFGLHERWRDIKDALAEAGHPLTNANGNTPLRALRELIAERDALRAAVPASASPNIAESNDRADAAPDDDEERDDSPYCDCGVIHSTEEADSGRCDCCGKLT